jgi:hypothetical protein
MIKSLFPVIMMLISNFAYTQDLTRKEAAEDIQFAIKKLKELHPDPFFKTSKKDFNNAVKKSIDNLSENNSSRYLQAETNRLLALVHDTHTRCRDMSDFVKTHWEAGGKIFPIYPHSKNGVVRVHGFFGADPNTFQQIHKGDRLVAIDHTPIDSVFRQCFAFISGDSDYEKYPILEQYFYYYLWLLQGSRNSYTLDLIDAAGNPYTETIDAVRRKEGIEKDTEKKESSANPFSFTFYNNKTVCLFDASSFDSKLWSTYRQTLDQCLREMSQSQTGLLVVDLRKNGGGHGGLGTELLQKTTKERFKGMSKYTKTIYPLAFAFKQKREKNWLSFRGNITPIDSPWKGQVVLLCGLDTGSAAVCTAATAKDNHIALIAGQETGGRPSAFMEIVTIELPNSKLRCDISTCYFLRPGGYDDGRGVLPDLPLDITLSNEAIIEKIQTYLESHPVNQENKP